jgi:hypothetical protein
MSENKEKMMGHTPGPWRNDEYGIRDRGGYICGLHWPMRYQAQDDRFVTEQEERLADARLIAAAPDLLAALRKILHQFELNLPKHGVVHDERQALIDAHAAIAKATGQ